MVVADKIKKGRCKMRRVLDILLTLAIVAVVFGCSAEPESKEVRQARMIEGFNNLRLLMDRDPNLARAFNQLRTNQAWEETRYTVGGESREPLYIGCDNDDR